jgi:tetratricopeptide (TPR) repeat protein
MQKNKSILIIVILAVIGVVGYYIWGDLNKNSVSVSNFPDSNLQEGSIDLGDGIVADYEESSSAESLASKYPPPSLDKQIVFKNGTSEEEKTRIRMEIETISKQLKDNNNLSDAWMQLGLLRKSISDYEGAEEAFEYATKIRPEDALAYGNLGVLYGYYIKDNVNAEKNYLMAIEKEPTTPFYYYQTYEFYHDVLKDNVKAKEILERGLEWIPGVQELKHPLENL